MPDVEVAIDPAELEGLDEEGVRALYEERLAQQQSTASREVPSAPPTHPLIRSDQGFARECLSLLNLPAEPQAQRSLLDTSGMFLLDHSSRVLQGDAGDCLSLLGSQQNLQPKGCPQLTQQGVRHRPSGHVLANQVPAGSMHA